MKETGICRMGSGETLIPVFFPMSLNLGSAGEKEQLCIKSMLLHRKLTK